MITLTDEELVSSTWLKISTHFEARLDELRQQNDGYLSPEDTARLRGRIHNCKEILALGNPLKPDVGSADPEGPDANI